MMLPSLRKVIKYQSSSGNYTLCFVVHTIKARPSCGVPKAAYGILVHLQASLYGRQTILWMSHDL